MADYQRFLQHVDPIIGNWAVHCIGEQDSPQATDSFVNLLTDDDSHLRIVAALAIGGQRDRRFEPALLAVWPDSQGFVRNWLTQALG